MKSALYSGLLDKLYLYVFCDNYFVPFALYFRKIIKKSKEYQYFEILEVYFPAMWRLKFKNFLRQAQPRCAYLVGKGGEGKGREEKGRGEGMGCFYLPPPPLQNVLLQPCLRYCNINVIALYLLHKKVHLFFLCVICLFFFLS